MTFQSAASQPTKSTRLRGAAMVKQDLRSQMTAAREDCPAGRRCIVHSNPRSGSESLTALSPGAKTSSPGREAELLLEKRKPTESNHRSVRS